MIDALILSDIHLGSDICRYDKVRIILDKIRNEELKINKLILNGDIFDSHDLRRLHKPHWKILSLIRKISDKVKVIWIAGNHDGPYDIISTLIGTEAVDEYILESGGKKILILHGDRFDDFISNRPILTKLADNIYRFIQKSSPQLARLIKRKSKIYLRCTDLVKQRAINYSHNKSDFVVAGHTHKAESSSPYFNSGCFTDIVCNYLIVKDGNIILQEI